MVKLAFDWSVSGAGWARCTIADTQTGYTAHISYISTAPESLLEGVTRIVLGARHIKVHIEGEPGSYRWIFDSHGDLVDVRLLSLEYGHLPDSEGHTAWETRRQPVTALARAVIRGFDRLATDLGEDAYLEEWGSPFPRTELERLRKAWRAMTAATEQPEGKDDPASDQ